jgi:hypothetical protein
MATDYDKRPAANALLEELKAQLTPVSSPSFGLDEADPTESLRLLDAIPSESDLAGDAPSLRIIPRQHDEFVCTHCFLVQHRTRLFVGGAEPICRDCAT